MRRAVVVVACLFLAGSIPIVDGAAHAVGASSRGLVTVTIVGSETFRPNGEQSTYRFPDAPTKVSAGGTITFVNQTGDGHAPTVVPKADLPTSFNCPDCNATANTFFPRNGPPAALSIQGGSLDTDDTWPDTFADTPTFANPVALNPDDGSLTNGDAVLIDAAGPNNSGGPTSVAVTVGGPGTYYYVCSFHPWMLGTIIVH